MRTRELTMTSVAVGRTWKDPETRLRRRCIRLTPVHARRQQRPTARYTRKQWASPRSGCHGRFSARWDHSGRRSRSPRDSPERHSPRNRHYSRESPRQRNRPRRRSRSRSRLSLTPRGSERQARSRSGSMERGISVSSPRPRDRSPSVIPCITTRDVDAQTDDTGTTRAR